MKVTATKKIGGVDFTFEVEEASELEALQKGITLGNIPHYCNCCKGYENFKLKSNKDKENNIYVNVICMNKKADGSYCNAQAKLGQYKSGGWFWHPFKYVEKKSDGGI
jgi:hypothetical protein